MREMIPAKTKIICDGCGKELQQDEIVSKVVQTNYISKLNHTWKYCLSCSQISFQITCQKTKTHSTAAFIN